MKIRINIKKDNQKIVKLKKSKGIEAKQKDASTASIAGFVIGQLIFWFILDKIFLFFADILGVPGTYNIGVRVIVSIIFSIILVGGISMVLTRKKAMEKLAYGK